MSNLEDEICDQISDLLSLLELLDEVPEGLSFNPNDQISIYTDPNGLPAWITNGHALDLCIMASERVLAEVNEWSHHPFCWLAYTHTSPDGVRTSFTLAHALRKRINILYGHSK